jgi:hypothetical protein
MKDHAPVPQVASYLADVGDEFSPSRFRSYIAEIRQLVPPREYRRLRQACRHLTEMRATVRRVTRRLATNGKPDGI